MNATPQASTDPVFSGLEPAAVWTHFARLCRIPRQSKAEGPLREEIRLWALARGLSATVDAAGNLLLRKPASGGLEKAPGVILQAHLDMLCQKEAETAHDFARDPIRPVRRDGWLLAEGTTLGADNGIGVALILAALDDASLLHGPLEALLTVDEEAGMGGARGLEGDLLHGRLLLNLDTEEWGEFYLGCAGGLDVNVKRDGTAVPLPAGFECRRIDLYGLRGGHSGIDIHEERGNAIKLLVRVLRDLEKRFPLHLAEFRSGSARNSLPREASAVVAVPARQVAALVAGLGAWQWLLREELLGVDEAVSINLAPATARRGSLLNRVVKTKTSRPQTSMHRPQLVQWPDVMTGPKPLSAPFSAGRMTWCSGHTAKQSMQSSHCSRSTADTRSTAPSPSRP